jgi:hypothetical protein
MSICLDYWFGSFPCYCVVQACKRGGGGNWVAGEMQAAGDAALASKLCWRMRAGRSVEAHAKRARAEGDVDESIGTALGPRAAAAAAGLRRRRRARRRLGRREPRP